MLKKEKLLNISKKLITNQDDFVSSFRKNLFLYIKEKEITINDISEESGVSFSTLNSFLYGKSNNMQIGNAIKLARALNVSIDELVGAGTIPDISRESVSLCRNLPENDLYLVRWLIRYLDCLNRKTEPNKRYVSVMELECECGNLKITSNYRKIDITDIKDENRHKIFFGITMPCDNYMPVYSPYDILLIANDREPMKNENVILRTGKYLWIAKKYRGSDFYSIRDGKYRCNEEEIDEVIGYVAEIVQK